MATEMLNAAQKLTHVKPLEHKVQYSLTVHLKVVKTVKITKNLFFIRRVGGKHCRIPYTVI